nr:CotH kinase family protein [Bacilli bacterium]
KTYGDVYFPANLTISVNGVTSSYEEVGVKMKGNTTRREVVDSEGNIYQPCHFKVSLKATFDDYLYDLEEFTQFKHDWSSDAAGRKARKKRNYEGLEKFDLKYLPRNHGRCGIESVYANYLFQKNGVLAPNSNFASVTLDNGVSTLEGSYELIEPIDKDFLKRRLPTSEVSGDLYKCRYLAMGKANLNRDGAVEEVYDEAGHTIGGRVANGKIGVEDDYAGYHPLYALKTNDDLGEDSDFSKMANYINTLWNIRYMSLGRDVLDSVLDISSFAKMEAISYLLGNFDDQRHNANNYYIYFRPSDGKAIYIPYDWDWALGQWEGNADNLPTENPYYTKELDGRRNSNNLYFVTLLAPESEEYSVTDIKKAYEDQIKEAIKNKTFAQDGFDYVYKFAPDDVKVNRDADLNYILTKTATVNNYLGE